ncbi:MAG: MFS transporter [Actinobacteria bacterium]|uniref:Multidrug efflux pump Tap n=1 Tax=freshwater metagenome TaxID=449393 RepID=A0A6J6HZB1_9ZZZZ|nr:MFS transporter [Actinomycetota bacterium]
MILNSVKEKQTKVPFVLTQISSIFSVMAGSMVFMAFPWLALQLTGSATSAGILVSITAIPGLLLAPVLGSIIDKFGRKVTILWIEALCALVSALIPFVSGLWVMTLPILIVIGLVRSSVASGSNTARKTFVPDVARVGGYTLERANSIQEAIFASGFALGPAVAALCIGWIGAYNTFYVVALCCVIAGLVMIPVNVREHKEDHEDEKSLFKFAVEGFTVLFKTPSVFIMMLGVMSLAMIYLPTEMVVLPKYYNLLNEPQQLGTLLSAMAAFTVVGSLMFERLSKRFKYSTIFRIAMLGVAASMVPMSFLLDYGWMLFFGALLGLAWGPMPPLMNTVIQRKVPPSKRGRVFSLEMVIWSGGPMISMVFVGIAVDSLGVSIVYKVIAALVLVAGALVTFSKYMKEINTADYES